MRGERGKEWDEGDVELTRDTWNEVIDLVLVDYRHYII